jgi:hypothetical protein
LVTTGVAVIVTFGTALIVINALLEQLLFAGFLTVTVCEPGASPLHPPAG